MNLNPTLLAVALGSALLAACHSRSGDTGAPVKVDQFNNLRGATRDLTVELREATNMAASPSPDGKRIVFSAQGALWIMPIAGGVATRLTDWTVEPTAPVWSPDGKTIAFQNYAPEGNYHIGTITPDGRKLSELTTGPFDDREPAWLPDGKALVFSSDRSQNGQYKIWSVAVQGKALTQLTLGSGAESNPVVSPDGRRLAFVDAGNIYTLALGTAAAPVLVAAGSVPAWTPDSGGLVLQNAAGQLEVGGREVSGSEDLFPFPVRFLADGRFLYTADGKIRVRDAGGNLPSDIAFSAILHVRRPVFVRTREHGFNETGRRQADAGRIAYTTLSGQLEIWDIARGAPDVIIASASTQVSTPSWTPDGRRIMVVDNERINNRFREGYNKLRVIDLASGQGVFHPVAPAPRQISERDEGAAVLSPDGRQVAFIMDSLLHVMPVNADGSPAGAAVAITREAADLPSWSGDSRTILYKSANTLKTVQADGANERTVGVDLQWTQAITPGTTLVHAGALWDGVTPGLQQNVDILITGNRITWIGPHQPGSETLATRFIDASALTLMPGLWDPHIHPLTLYQGGQFGQVAALMLSYGVTSAHSVAGPLHQSVELRDAQQQAKVLAAGALVANGSDTPLAVPGISLHLNLRAAGMVMSNFQALQTVTINAARMALVERDLGSAEAGKLADLVAVRGNPLDDLRAAANVEYVIKNGNVFPQAQILAPFRTPAALAQRRKALVAFAARCKQEPPPCGADSAHAD